MITKRRAESLIESEVDQLTTKISTQLGNILIQLNGLRISNEANREKINAILEHLGVTARWVPERREESKWVVEKKKAQSK